MMDPHCRIVRVRPKVSPHLTVHVLAQRDLRPEYRADAAAIARAVEGAITGYAVVAWDRRGAMTTAFAIADGPFNVVQAPQIVADALRRHDTIDLTRGR